MTALGGDELSRTWEALAERLSRPQAILMVSAHWTTRVPMLTGSDHPETIHDFGGFPAELYRLRYTPPGGSDLAQRLKQQLTAAGMATGIDAHRGLDHGAWVPLRVLFPKADVPVLQLSIQPDRCARHHYALGAALAALPAENILIIASGHMTHNLRDYFQPDGIRPAPESLAFRQWTHERLVSGDFEALLDWQYAAPGAAQAHPTVEHFLPLLVALGAAGKSLRTEWLGGGWIEQSLAADNYLLEQV